MMGDDTEDVNRRGIIPRLCHELFDRISTFPCTHRTSVSVTFVEIYREQVNDILDPARTNLRLRGTLDKGFFLDSAKRVLVDSAEELLHIIGAAQRNRSTAATSMNARSSRSHALFTISTKIDNGEGSVLTGRLNLVDLAGSENIAKTGASGTRLDEAKRINQSLSALGNVINALTDPSASHVPYRDSKLTQLLANSLGGNAKTTLVVCASPSFWNLQETLSTLRFGARAKTVKNHARVNREYSKVELKRLIKLRDNEIKRLKDFIARFERRALDAISESPGRAAPAAPHIEPDAAFAPSAPLEDVLRLKEKLLATKSELKRVSGLKLVLEKENFDLREEVCELEERLKSVRRGESDEDSEHMSERSADGAHEALERAQKRMKELDALIAELKSTKPASKQRVAELTEQLQRANDRLAAERKRTNISENILSEELLRVRAEHELLKGKYNRTITNLKITTSDVEDIHRRLKRTARERAQYKKRAEALEQRVGALQEGHTLSEGTLKARDEKLAQILREVIEVESLLPRDGSEEPLEEGAGALSHIYRIRSGIQGLTARLVALETHASELRGWRDAISSGEGSSTEIIEKLAAEKTEAQNQFTCVRAQAERLEAQLGTELAEHERKRSTLESLLKSANEKLTRAESSEKALVGSLSKLREQATASAEEAQKREKTISELRETLGRSEETRATLLAEVESLSTQCAELGAVTKEAEEGKSFLQAEVASLKEENAKILNEKSTIETSLRELYESAIGLGPDDLSTTQIIETIVSLLKSPMLAEAMTKTMRRSVFSAKTQSTIDLFRIDNEDLKGQNSALGEELEAARSRVNRLSEENASYKELLARRDSDNSAFARRVEESKLLATRMKDQLESTQKSLDETTDMLSAARQRCSELEDENERKNERILHFKTAGDRAQQRSAEADAMRQQSEQLTEQLRAELDKLSARNKELLKLVSSLRQRTRGGSRRRRNGATGEACYTETSAVTLADSDGSVPTSPDPAAASRKGPVSSRRDSRRRSTAHSRSTPVLPPFTEGVPAVVVWAGAAKERSRKAKKRLSSAEGVRFIELPSPNAVRRFFSQNRLSLLTYDAGSLKILVDTFESDAPEARSIAKLVQDETEARAPLLRPRLLRCDEDFSLLNEYI